MSADVFQVGVDHHLAPLDVRERIALDPDAQPEVALAIRNEGWASEVALLSTCNRTELYVASSDLSAGGLALGSLLRHLPHAPDPDRGCYRRQGGEAAARYLLRVACGLESALLGETEIQGQVRQAHVHGRKSGSIGPVLDRLFQTAVRTGKRARSETAVSGGGTSHGSAAAQVVRRVFGRLAGRNVLVVGAGQMATQAARALLDLEGGSYVVANRTPARAAALAKELPEARTIGLEGVPQALAEAHVAVLASRAEPISVGDVEQALVKRREPLLMVDLGMPRCVDAAAGALPGVFLYDLETLASMVAGALETRRRAVPAVELIIREELDTWRSWLRGQRVVPTIHSLNAWAESLRQAELSYLPDDIAPDARNAVEKLTKRLVQRLLGRAAARVVKGASDEDPNLPTAEHLRSLFGLEDGEEK